MSPFNHLVLYSSLVLAAACSSPQAKQEALSIEERADTLAHRFIITDGHIDLPFRMKIANFRLEKEYLDVTEDTDGDFDYVKAQAGGLNAPFMSIYVPASYQETGGAKQFADSLIDMVNGITERYPDKFAQAPTPQSVEENFEKGLISLPMGMENGAPVGDSRSPTTGA